MIATDLDLSLLALMRDRAVYHKYIGLIDLYSLSPRGKEIIDGYNEYFNNNKDVEVIDLSEFSAFFLQRKTNEEQAEFKHIITRILHTAPSAIEDTATGLRYRKGALIILKALGIDDTSFSKPVDLKYFDSHKLEATLKKFNKSIDLKLEEYTHDLAEVFKFDESEYLPSSIKSINNIILGYRRKYFHLIQGGYDSGKTALCISEAVNTARSGKSVIYFVNEQSEQDIRMRMAACLLNENQWYFPKFKKWVANNLKMCQNKYNELVGDNLHLIKPSYSVDALKKYCDKLDPKLIVLDQIDHLLTGKDSQAQRPYERLYMRLREEIAQVYAPLIGTSQTQGGGKYWSKAQNKEVYNENQGAGSSHWSNVDKQANVDVILTLSVMNNDTTLRHIIIDRHKEGLKGDGYCRLQEASSRFIDL